jgi:diguanylate cyclase (GGDEF)-like protein/putative nucleotidyltransferase with HDIG domain
MKARFALNSAAQVFLWLISITGALILAVSIAYWQSADPYRFGCVVLLASAAAGFKVALPEMSGTLSANFLFVLYGIVEFSFPETVLLAAFLTLTQCIANWSPKMRVEQVAFNTGLSVVSTALAYFVSHLAVLQRPYLEASVRLFAAAIVLFLVNNLPTVYMIAQADGKSFRQVWRDCFMWALPYYILGASAAGLGVVTGRHIGWQTAFMIVPILYLVYRSYRLYLSQIEDEKKHTSEMASLHLRTIEALALAIEAKDTNSHDHLHRVQVFCTGIAEKLGLPADEIQALRAASLLHDIGKLAVPEHIISKRGELTAEELDRLKIHPVIGAEILGRVRFPYPVEPIVRWHHERWDGSGYPDGIAGDAIPIGARILSVVDAFDSLSVRLAPSSTSPLADAITLLRAEAGRAFDPYVVETLAKLYVQLEEKAIQNARQRPRLTGGLANSAPSAPAAGFVTEGQGSNGSASDFFQSIAAARQEVNTLFELAQDLGNSLSLDETISVLTRRMERIIPHDCIVLYLVANKRLSARHCDGEVRPRWVGSPMAVGEGLSGWVAENRKPILNGNPAVEPGYVHDEPAILRSALAVPLEGMSGIMGVITLYSRERDAFSKDHLRILLAISSKIALSVENALRFLQAENSATTDYLTGLPNARSLYQHLEKELARCQRTGQACSVLVCDLDGFKQVNDRFGHLEGNRVLRLVSVGMQSVCREYDYVARMGGDEFVVVLPGLAAQDVEAKSAQFVKVAVDAGYEISGEKVLAMSIGAAQYPTDGMDRETLLQCADERMYGQKRKNKKRPAIPVAGSGLPPWKPHAPPKTTTY